ncbi:hypothetical protein CSB20_01860 [bacterium DOLZORAL124_64_63]|nr:MAG: hypothetical protein CSB20_01860 [bacterium DOLZORAL124_64_63]
MTAEQQPTAIFVADSHFHLNPDEREQRRIRGFCDLMERAADADHLFLLGDIFDFWFDYPHFRLRGYEEILQALDRVRAAGTDIHFVGGNHDIWAATYLHQRYGTRLDGEPFIISLGSRRLNLVHGDGLLSHDWAYNTFRSVVRTRAGIVLAKSLHPEILFALSTWLSGHSRGATRDEAEQIETKGARWIQRQQDADWDLTIMGHVHHPFQAEAHGRRLIALAGWFDTLGYGLLQDGHFRLLDFERDPKPIL